MNLENQKRLAAQVLDISHKKIWFDNTRLEEIKEAITKADIRGLIKEGAIVGKKTNALSKARVRFDQAQKRKGRRKGEGTKKGTLNAKISKKRRWINHIRVQRSYLKLLREKKAIDSATFRSLYLKSKGGFFRSKRHLKMYLGERGILKHENTQ